MEAKKNNSENTEPKKKSGLKKTLYGIGGICVILLLILVLLPTLISTQAGKNFILGRVNQSIDGTVQVSDLSLGWFSGLKLTHVQFKDNAGTTSATVGEIRLKPKLSSLLKGQINLTDGLIDKPQVEITVKDLPVSPAPASKSSPSTGTSSSTARTAVLPLEKLGLELRQGSAVIKTENPPQKLEFKNITSKVNINPVGQASSMSFALAVSGTGAAGDVKGTASVTPTKGIGLEGTSGDVQVEMVNIKLEDFKPLMALAGQSRIDIAGLINANADVKLTDGQFEKIEANATVENFKQTLDGKTTALTRPVKIKALAAMTDGALRIDNLNVDSSFCSATCKGDLNALTYQAKADLAGVQNFASQFTDMAGYKLAGSLNATGSVNMKNKVIQAAGTADFQNLAIAKGAEKIPASGLKVTYDVTHDSAAQLVKASSIDVTLDAGRINLKDIAVPLEKDKMTQLSVKAEVAGLDLQKTLNLAKPFLAPDTLPKDMTLAGKLNSQIQIQPKGQDIQFVIDKTEIQNLVVGQVGQTPFVQDILTLTADGNVNPTTKMFASNFNLEAKKEQSIMRVKGAVSQKPQNTQTALAGDLQAEYDLKEVTAMARPFMPKGLEMEGKRNDKITFASTYPAAQPEKMAANLNANAALGFSKANFMGLNFGPTEMKLDVKQGKAKIDLPDADVNGGKIRFAGDIDLGAKPMLLTLRQPAQVVDNVKIDDVISAQLLQYINPVFARATNVSGIANLNCKTLAIPLAGGAAKNIVIDGAVGLQDVRLNSNLLSMIGQALQIKLDLFNMPQTPFTVKNGVVQYTDMPLIFGGKYTMHFRGSVGLDKSLAMSVEAPLSLDAAAKKIVIPLTGTLDNPKPDLAALVTSNIAEQLPIKDKETKKEVEKALEIFQGVLKPRQK